MAKVEEFLKGLNEHSKVFELNHDMYSPNKK